MLILDQRTWVEHRLFPASASSCSDISW